MSTHITPQPIPGLDNKLVKHKKLIYPVPGDPALPRMYFVGLWCAARGGGKTFSMVKLLKLYEKSKILDKETGEIVDQRVIVMCPSMDANPIYNSLKHLDPDDVHTMYSDAKLQLILDEIKHDRNETVQYQTDMRIYKKFLKARKESELTPEELHRLAMLGYEPPSDVKYPRGCVVFLVLDDLVASPAFKSQGRSALTNLVLRNRHCGICVMIATQHLKAVPRSIRLNVSLWVLYKLCNVKTILDDMYPEVAGVFTEQQFIDAYAFATNEPHDCLVVDLTGGLDENRVRKNWSTRLLIENLGNEMS